jgi:hypothetical protein
MNLFIVGQINIQSQPIMTNQSILQAMATQLQQGAIPLGHQPLQLSASGQSPTILPGQPVYIRTTQIQGQQGSACANRCLSFGLLFRCIVDFAGNVIHFQVQLFFWRK